MAPREAPGEALRLALLAPREALLAAAHRLFAAKGYEATTIDEIASTAGFTRGAFYANFRNKEATMEALIAGGFSDDADAIGPIGEMSDLEEMKKGYQEYSQRFQSDPESLMWALEFQMAALRHPSLRTEYNRQYRSLTDRVTKIIKAVLLDAGHPNATALEPISEVFVAIQISLNAQRILDPDRVPEQVLSLAFETLVAGLLSSTSADENQMEPRV